MLKLCAEEGIGVLPWSPLARGRLARPWQKEANTKRSKNDEYGIKLYGKTEDQDKKVIDAVTKISKDRAASQATVSLSWLLSKPVVTSPIVGATKLSHIDDAVSAVYLKLTEDEINKLEENYVPHPVAGFSYP